MKNRDLFRNAIVVSLLVHLLLALGDAAVLLGIVLAVLAGVYFVFAGLFDASGEPTRGRCSFCLRPKETHDRDCPLTPRR